MYFNKTYYDEHGKPTEIEIICNKCGNTLQISDVSKFQTITNEYCIVKENQTIQCKCGNLGNGILQYKQNPKLDDLIRNNPQNYININKTNVPKCPTCGSMNIKKISTASKAVGAMAFGLFSKTAKSQFECENCKYKW
jgi:Zn finger protein HypA/HybF involved in hydrogenase expression